MKHPLLVLAALIPFTLHAAEQTAADTPKPARASESGGIKAKAQGHEGIWKPIAAVMRGARLPPPALKAITLKITGDTYEVTVEGEKEPDKGTCTLDTTTNPKRMTIKSTDGPNRGQTFLAIYEMKDEVSLRVCYDLSGKEFPKEFKAPKDTHLYLVGYRRQKDPQTEIPPVK